MTDTAPQTEPTPIDPGETFLVEYGSGKLVEVKALNMRDQKTVSRHVRKLMEAEKAQDPLATMDLFEVAEQLIELCVVSPTDEFCDSISAQNALEISVNTLSYSRVSEEQAKKSESPL